MDIPLTHVRGIGPARLKALRDAGLEGVRDLVLYLPREYRDMTRTTPLTDVRAGEPFACRVRVAGEVGLDVAEARALLASDRYADEVREREQFYLQNGIHSVPAIIINERHLISGGQPVEVFEQALRQIAAQS